MRRLWLCLIALLATSLPAQTPRAQQVRAVVRDAACAPATGWILRDTTFSTLTAARTYGQRNPLFCAVTPPPPVDTVVSATQSTLAFVTPMDSLRVGDSTQVRVTLRTTAGAVLGTPRVVQVYTSQGASADPHASTFDAGTQSYTAFVRAQFPRDLEIGADVVGGVQLTQRLRIRAYSPVVTPPPPPVPGSAFLESFTGQPTTPRPFASPLWDVLQFTTHAGGGVQVNPTSMMAQHSEMCAGPPATHLVTTYEQQVFLCRDHLMTAVSEEGNGGIVLTPTRMLDFGSGEQVLSFDLNTASQSGRDWWLAWITPWEDVLQAPVFPDDGVSAMNGTPRNAILIDAEADNPCAVVIVNFVRTRLPCNTYPALKDRFPVSFSVRDKIEIRLSRTRIRVSMPARGITFVDAALPQPLTWSQGVVQLGHYSYNPTKDNQLPNPQPNTWHWDEVFISNAIPFTIIAADRRDLTNADGPVTVNFAAPAPANATLRMLARGARPEISLDNGATWRVPPLAPYSFFEEPNEQYVMPIPAGARSIRVRRGALISWWPGNAGWFVRGFSIWARP